jgi:hypothetical protein
MATRGGYLTACLLTVFGWALGASAECGAVETPELASYRALTRDDFVGEKPRDADRVRGIGATAILIVTAMAVDAVAIELAAAQDGAWIARPAALCVRSYLMKRKSGWRRDVSAAWDVRHEQGHFDLTESRARQLEAQLAKLSATGDDTDAAKRALHAEIARVYRAATSELQAEQDRYDRETRHGNHRFAQGRWNDAIAAALAPVPRIAQAARASEARSEAESSEPSGVETWPPRAKDSPQGGAAQPASGS